MDDAACQIGSSRLTRAHRQVSEAGLKLLMGFEGYRHRAARLTDGRWVIGYGHTRSARAGAQVSEADARALLIYDLREIGSAITAAVAVPLSQHQFDALACFAFNIGLENFRRSTVLRLVNVGDMLDAAYALEQWRKAEVEGEAVVIDGLVRRRAAEKALFLTPPAGWEPAPSAVIRPEPDHRLMAFGGIGLCADLHADLGAEDARVVVVSRSALAPFPAPVEEPAEILTPPVSEPPQPQTWTPEPVDMAQGLELEPSPQPVSAPIHTRFGEFEYATVEADAGGYWPWVGLCLLGVIVFALSVLWALGAHGPAGPFSPQVIGTLLALAGVACVVCAIYLMIQRYLGRDD